MNFKYIGKRGREKVSVETVERLVKIIRKQSIWAVAEGGCVLKEEYLKVGEYCSIFESQSNQLIGEQMMIK